MFSPILKLEIRTDNEVPHSSRDQDLPRRCPVRDTRADVNRDAAELFSGGLAFAGMQARPDLDTEWARTIVDGTRTPNGLPQSSSAGANLT